MSSRMAETRITFGQLASQQNLVIVVSILIALPVADAF